MGSTDSTMFAARHADVPDAVARQIVLPEGHLDEPALFAAYRWLRENAPLARVAVDGYDPLWLVSTHADVTYIGREAALFTSGGGAEPGTHNPILQNQAGDAFIRSVSGGSLRSLDAVVYLDGPEHAQVRGIANEWFKPSSLKRWTEAITALAQQAIADRLRPGVNDLDIVGDFALFYPLHVIMSLFGIPAQDEPQMMALTQELFGTSDPESQRAELGTISADSAARQMLAARADFFVYFDTLIDSRRAEPRADLASLIANARTPDGEFYPRAAAYGWFIAITTAGHDTTSSTLSGILEALAEHPDVLEQIRAEPSLVTDLVNEGLRWVSPVKHFVRQASADCVVSGQRIAKGDRMMLLFQSANRDDAAFESPDEFRLGRTPSRHIAFGAGPHTCIGMHLAKLELRIMLEQLLPRVEALEITGARKVVQTNFVGGLRRRPMRLHLA